VDTGLAATLEALVDTRSLVPVANAAGACSARAALGGMPVVIAAADPSLDSGAIGRDEAQVMAAAADAARDGGSALLLCLDSAGARLTEGVPVLGAFRRLQQRVAEAVQAGVPVAAVLGRHCFGGASLLACTARTRFYRRDTLLGLSGPRALGGVAGVRLLPEAVDEIYGVQARLRRDPAGVLADPVELHATLRAWRRDPGGIPDVRARQRELLRGLPRLRGRDEPLDMQHPPEALESQLDHWFPGGWDAAFADGTVAGEGWVDGGHASFAGLVGGVPVDAHGAWRMARALLDAAEPARPPVMVLLLDSPGQAAGLDDERLMPSMAVAQVSAAAARLRATGRRILLWLAGEAGGAIYVALAAAAHEVAAFHATRLQTLPAGAVAGVLGAGRDLASDTQAWTQAGVVDRWVRSFHEVPLS
jgi:hypothetical protein